MNGANRANGGRAPCVEQGVELGKEALHACRCLSARLQEVHDFETRMVVDKDEQILVAATGRYERTGNVRVNDTAGVAGHVLRVRVRAYGRPAESGWRVRRDIGQGAKAVVAGVQPAMHVLGRQAGRHGMNVGGGLRGSDGHRPWWGDDVGGRVTHGDALRHDLRV
eukprot:3573325-Pleurochrysis_carterae.AAC.1